LLHLVGLISLRGSWFVVRHTYRFLWCM